MEGSRDGRDRAVKLCRRVKRTKVRKKHAISTLKTLSESRASLIAQPVKNSPAVQETLIRFLRQEDSLGKGCATHSSTHRLPWRLRQERMCLRCGRPAFNP